MMPVATCLEALDAGSIDTMFKYWATKQDQARVRGKGPRIAALAEILSAGAAEAAAGWPGDLRAALHEAGSVATIGALFDACHARGLREVDRLVRTLLERGAVLVTRAPSGYKLRWNEVFREPGLPIRVAPGLTPPPPAPPPERLCIPAQEDAPSAVLADASLLGAALLAVGGLVTRRRLRLNADGYAGAPLVDALVKAVAGRPPLNALAFEVALACGMITADGASLTTTPLVDSDLDDMLDRAFRGFLARGRWLDDTPAASDLYAVDEIRSSLYDGPGLADAVSARTAVAGALRRLDTPGWVPFDAVVGEILAIDAVLLHRHERHRGYSSVAGPANASQWRAQRDYCFAVIGRTFHAFGMVDLAGAALPPFTRRGRDPALDARFRDDASYQTGASARPMWRPDASPLLLRVTPLGRRLLAPPGAVSRPRAPSAGVHVGADFEVVAERRSASPNLLFRLDAIALALPHAAADPARRWKLDRARWIEGLQGGQDGAAVLAELAAASTRPLPANVVATIEGWASTYGAVSLYAGFDLVEFANAKARDAAGGVAVGERSALLPGGRTKGQVFDYAKAPSPCVRAELDGALRVEVGDLRVARALSRIAEGAGAAWRLRPDRFAGLNAVDQLAQLQRLLVSPIHPGLAVAIRGWCGAVAPARAGRVEVLQLEDAATAEALAWRPEIAACIEGVLPGGLLIIAPRERAALTRELAALGIRVEEGLRKG